VLVWHELVILTPSGQLRERQATVIREAILDALAGQLERADPDDVALPQVAADAARRARSWYGRCYGPGWGGGLGRPTGGAGWKPSPGRWPR
jgi:hypothetical protein